MRGQKRQGETRSPWWASSFSARHPRCRAEWCVRWWKVLRIQPSKRVSTRSGVWLVRWSTRGPFWGLVIKFLALHPRGSVRPVPPVYLNDPAVLGGAHRAIKTLRRRTRTSTRTKGTQGQCPGDRWLDGSGMTPDPRQQRRSLHVGLAMVFTLGPQGSDLRT